MTYIDFAYVDYREIENDNHPDIVPTTHLTYEDDRQWLRFIHSIPKEYLQHSVCLYLGMKPYEIVEALQYANISKYYAMNHKVKDFYKREKIKFFDI